MAVPPQKGALAVGQGQINSPVIAWNCVARQLWVTVLKNRVPEPYICLHVGNDANDSGLVYIAFEISEFGFRG